MTVQPQGEPAPTGATQPEPETLSDWVARFRQAADEHDAAGEHKMAARLRERARSIEQGLWENYIAHDRELSLAKVREWEAKWAHSRAWQLKNMEGVLELGRAGLKGFVLVNAGACVALLAFLGNVWTKGVYGEPFIVALAIFASGVFVAALATALSYLTQLYYSSDDDAELAIGRRWHKASGFVALASLLLFACGVSQSVAAFRVQPALKALAGQSISGATAEATMATKNQPPPPRPPAAPPRPASPPPPPPPPPPQPRR